MLSLDCIKHGSIRVNSIDFFPWEKERFVVLRRPTPNALALSIYEETTAREARADETMILHYM